MNQKQQTSNDVLLEVESLSLGFKADDASGDIGKAITDVSFKLHQGRCLCIVGESGCGKSVTALGLTRLLPMPPAVILGGQVLFDGQNLLNLPENKLARIRGSRIGMIFQDPMTSLNPVMRVGEQIAEPLIVHKNFSRAEARKKVLELLQLVGIPEPASSIDYFPHQMSGGMRQRVMISTAIACEPEIIIADEPTTALDVTIQRQILELLRSIVNRLQASLLLITHDFNVVESIADNVAVMYAGSIIEQGTAKDVLENPLHPYTQGLLASRPSCFNKNAQNPNQTSCFQQASKRPRLASIKGSVPSIWQRELGCDFYPRCFKAKPECALQKPSLEFKNPAQLCRCWLV